MYNVHLFLVLTKFLAVLPPFFLFQVASMQRPSVIVALNVEDQPTNENEMPSTRTVEFELSREALETVIDGLGKIRDQLSKMG